MRYFIISYILKEELPAVITQNILLTNHKISSKLLLHNHSSQRPKIHWIAEIVVVRGIYTYLLLLLLLIRPKVLSVAVVDDAQLYANPVADGSGPTNHSCSLSLSLKQLFSELISKSYKLALLRANFRKSTEDHLWSPRVYPSADNARKRRSSQPDCSKTCSTTSASPSSSSCTTKLRTPASPSSSSCTTKLRTPASPSSSSCTTKLRTPALPSSKYLQQLFLWVQQAADTCITKQQTFSAIVPASPRSKHLHTRFRISH